MAKNFNYHLEETKNAGDFYIYCDVFDWHFIRFEKWNSGIALADLENGKAIFNGQNGKSYFFNEDVPEDWIEDQFNKCVDKYSPISSYAASRIKFDSENAVRKIIEEKELWTTKMEKIDWKPWSKEAYRTIKPGRYHVKLDDGTVTYDDFRNRRPFGWGFSGYVENHIVEYAEF